MTTSSHTASSLSYYFEQRGYLHYFNGSQWVEASGWFMVSPHDNTVVRRKIGGRNRYQFTKEENVAAFYKDDNAR
jgi:hypothetical protein